MSLQLYILNIFLLFSSGLHVSHVSSEGEWKLVDKTDNWSVYTRKGDSSPIKEVKIEGVLKANYESVKTVMSDINEYPAWVYSCIKSYKIKEQNDDDYYSYTLSDLPFPINNRDLVVQTVQNTTADGYWYSISDAKPEHISEVKSTVRINKYHAEWKMKAKSDSSIEFKYLLAMEPGGRLPSWLVNMAIAKGPINTINALEKRSNAL